jgi:hypothetical protein
VVAPRVTDAETILIGELVLHDKLVIDQAESLRLITIGQPHLDGGLKDSFGRSVKLTPCRLVLV